MIIRETGSGAPRRSHGRRIARRGSLAAAAALISVLAAATVTAQGHPSATGSVASAATVTSTPACATGKTLAISFPNSSKIGAVQTTLNQVKKKLGALHWKVLIDDPGTDLNKQVNTIKTWTQQKVNAMMVVTLNPPVFEGLAKTARADGIKWITYGSTLKNEDAMVGFRQYADGVPLGEAAGRWINKTLHGRAKVAILTYEQGDWGRRRGKGIIDGLRKIAPHAQIVAQQDAISNTDGLNTARTILQAHPDLNVILGVEDPATEGAYQAWISAGKKKNDPKGFIGGMDGTPQALKLLQQGNNVYRASMAIPLIKLGNGIATTAEKLVCGKKTGNYVVPLVLVTPKSPLATQFLKDQGAS